MDKNFFLKGNICHTPQLGKIEIYENSYLLCLNGKSGGIFHEIPQQFANLPIKDYQDCLIIPGLSDLHIHAPQFAFRGIGSDCELLDWLYKYAYPEESKYSDPEYAQKAYSMFADALGKSATTRAVILATAHVEASLKLMDLMEKTGIVSYVGKVSMDRDAPENLVEADAKTAADAFLSFISGASQRSYKNTYPIVTPRFIPSCTEKLLTQLSEIQKKYSLPIQSHLSENRGEVELVKSLMPSAAFYGDAYNRFGLFGGEAPTVMAHCVHSSDEEIQLMKDNGVWVAHCPDCNMNVASGIAPIRKYLNKGLRVGIGTDVAGGHTESMFRAVVAAVQVSKIYWNLVDPKCEPLSLVDGIYLATKGGGSFFGKVGSFEDEYEFDAVVLDDSSSPHPQPLTVYERLQRSFYLGLDRTGIKAKYVRGRAVC